MENHFLYIIQSEVDGSYYTGSTQNVGNRVVSHNNGRGRYTRKKMPWKLVFQQEFISKREALRAENLVKRRKSRKFIQQLISGESKL